MVTSVFISDRTNHRALKTVPVLSILNTFKNKSKTLTTNYLKFEAVTFSMKIKSCVWMDQSGAPLAVSLSCDITTGKNQSDCLNCLNCKNTDYSFWQEMKHAQPMDVGCGHGKLFAYNDIMLWPIFFCVYTQMGLLCSEHTRPRPYAWGYNKKWNGHAVIILHYDVD